MSTVAKQGQETRRQSYDLLVAKVKNGQSLTPGELSAMARLEAELTDSGLDTPAGFRSVEEVAEYSGYKPRTVYAAVQAGDLSRLSDGSFDFGDVSEWLSKKRNRPAVGGRDLEQDDEPTSEFNAANEESRYRHFRARREEILVARLEAELIPKDEVSRQNVRRVHEFKTSLQLLSRRIDYKIAAACGLQVQEVKAIVDQEVEALLKALSRKVVLNVDIG